MGDIGRQREHYEVLPVRAEPRTDPLPTPVPEPGPLPDPVPEPHDPVPSAEHDGRG